MAQIYADEIQVFVFICEHLRNLRLRILLGDFLCALQDRRLAGSKRRRKAGCVRSAGEDRRGGCGEGVR